MQEVWFPVTDAIPGAVIEEGTPQSAVTADDTPAPASPDNGAEGAANDTSAAATPPYSTDTASLHADSAADGIVYYPVYNGQPVPVRAEDTERVTALLRQGLRFEQFLPQFEMLRRMSRAAGMHRPEELVDKLQAMAEEQEYRELLELAGGNETLAREVLEYRRASREREDGKHDEVQSPKPSTVERLAAEYGELKQLLPQAPAFSALPESVVRQAVESGKPLIQCYLLYEQQEQALRERAQQEAKAAAAASTGTLRGLPEDGESPMGESFRKAFRNWL